MDEWLWVVVGDVPPAYLVTDDAATPAKALGIYIDLMEEWVDAVEAGEPVGDLIPVATADGYELIDETPANAAMLKSRLGYLREQIVPEFALMES